MRKVTRLDDCQFLLSRHINYSLTYFAEHIDRFSHDAVSRYLHGEKLTARVLWENVRDHVVTSEQGWLVFDDTVIDKNTAWQSELVCKHDRGKAHGRIKGIDGVTCVSINPACDQFGGMD